ncbi:glycosyltransferase family 2 protein [Solibacillus sp. FSL R7-0668]|uniref:glycosyltransferase family 2 protein n=1 Tax=Solibacillus sp. FSL R7-0668 TaxID=2921688 RepID=UPI0030F713C6
MKKVQVLLSTYNGELYLQEQLDSLMNQIDIDLNILVRDDGSRDNTIRILENYAQKYNNIKVIRGENIGVVASFFELLRDADTDADYFAFCDQDDFWREEKLIAAVKKLEEHKDQYMPLLYCSKTRVVDEKLNFLSFSKEPKRSLKLENALVENMATGCTVVINKKCRQEIICKEINYKNIIMHDWWIYMIALLQGKVVYDANSYIDYRQHSSNVVGIGNGIYHQYLRKLKHFMNGKNKGLLKKQAQELYELYQKELTGEQLEIISSFCNERKSILSKINFILKNRFYRQSKIDSFFFYILVFIGRV